MCRGLLERSEPVPFRLTRNLQTFFTPFGVEGVFITAMAVAAQVSLLHLLTCGPSLLTCCLPLIVSPLPTVDCEPVACRLEGVSLAVGAYAVVALWLACYLHVACLCRLPYLACYLLPLACLSSSPCQWCLGGQRTFSSDCPKASNCFVLPLVWPFVSLSLSLVNKVILQLVAGQCLLLLYVPF